MSEQSNRLIREMPPTMLPRDSVVPLEAVLCTEELKRRPVRPPDYETENRALTALAQALAYSPQTILQTLADTILEVFKADSAGLSLLTKDEKSFYWPAIAGMWQSHVGGGTPRDFGPCGDVLDCNASLFFRHPERRYPYLLAAMPTAEEVLLVPFYVEGKAAGTIWAIAHDDRRKFDAEDLRQLESLGRFASAAYRAVAGREALRQSHTEVAERVAELQDARHAALNLMEDAIQSREAMEKLNAALGESEERYRTLFASAPMAVFACDRNAVIQDYNDRATELWGREPTRGVEQYCGSVKLWLPDGTLLPHAQSPIAEVLRAGIPLLNAEVFIERPDGSRLPVVVNFAPLRSADGEITGAMASFVDVTERKHAEDQRKLVLREMNHRVKNLFAVASSIVTMSVRSARTPKEMAEIIRGRLDALVRAHELIRPGITDASKAAGSDTTLDVLVRAILEPYFGSDRTGGRERVVAHGSYVAIGGSAATSFALVLHELATNATKYGALSVQTGSVHINWSTQNGELLLEWSERGGPLLDGPPGEEGFGSRMSRASIIDQLGGQISHEWKPKGLVVRLSVPLGHLGGDRAQ